MVKIWSRSMSRSTWKGGREGERERGREANLLFLNIFDLRLERREEKEENPAEMWANLLTNNTTITIIKISLTLISSSHPSSSTSSNLV